MKKAILAVAVLVFTAGAIHAQDMIVLTPNNGLIFLNPSFAGSNGTFRCQKVYNSSLPVTSSGQRALGLAADVFLKGVNGGIALCYDESNTGRILTNKGLTLVYSQHFHLIKAKLKVIPSLQVAYRQKTLEVSALHFGQSVNGLVWSNPSAIPSSRRSYADISSGLLVNYKDDLYAGVAVYHLSKPDEGLMGESRMPRRYVMHAAYSLHFPDKNLLQFGGMFVGHQKYNRVTIMVNTVLFRRLVLGGQHTFTESVGGNIGYRGNYIFTTVGYNMIVSKLAGSTRGPWELSLGWRLGKRHETVKNFENW